MHSLRLCGEMGEGYTTSLTLLAFLHWLGTMDHFYFLLFYMMKEVWFLRYSSGRIFFFFSKQSLEFLRFLPGAVNMASSRSQPLDLKNSFTQRQPALSPHTKHSVPKKINKLPKIWHPLWQPQGRSDPRRSQLHSTQLVNTVRGKENLKQWI